MFHLFFDTFSLHPCLTKWPPFFPTTWKCRHFFQKCSQLNQTKSPKSPGLWHGPILSSGTFDPGADHMAPLSGLIGLRWWYFQICLKKTYFVYSRGIYCWKGILKLFLVVGIFVDGAEVDPCIIRIKLCIIKA